MTAAVSGCASIVSDSTYPVMVSSEQKGTSFDVTNSDGIVVHSGETPTIIQLPASSGYFQGETYYVAFQKNEEKKTQLLDSGIDGWYFGNLLFGGLIGFLIVDPASGSMFDLPEYVSSDYGVFDEAEDYAKFQKTISDVPQDVAQN